jgi:alkylhydroperoxidase family enzyme
VLTDLDTAPIEERLRATLRMLAKLTREGTVTADDMRVVLSTGATRQQVEDALAVGTAFNITNRLADAFDFKVLDEDGFAAGARFLLKRGYGS